MFYSTCNNVIYMSTILHMYNSVKFFLSKGNHSNKNTDLSIYRSSLEMVTFNRYHLIISLLKLMIIKKKLGHIPSELFSNKPGTADGKSLDLAQDGRPWRLMGVGLLSYVTFEEVLFTTNPMITKITGNTSENTRLALLRKFRRIHIFTMALNWRLERFSVCFSRSSKSVSMVT